MLRGLPLLLACLALPSCIPGGVTRSQAIATAHAYSEIRWKPEARHIRHGRDADGIQVDTPDTSLAKHGFSNGWWKPGEEAKGMPYQWGGFDTPESFARALAKGEAAGDISTDAKRAAGDDAVSKHACGIDCSGFVSRCWNLPVAYSTRQLPAICIPLKAWIHLQPGDILLNHRHVLLFAGWKEPGKVVYAYEAGPFPYWRVNAAAIDARRLERQGYRPWRFRGMRDG